MRDLDETVFNVVAKIDTNTVCKFTYTGKIGSKALLQALIKDRSNYLRGK